MKDEIIDNGRICPLCGKTYYEPPALSRTDNKTLICSDYLKETRTLPLGGVLLVTSIFPIRSNSH